MESSADNITIKKTICDSIDLKSFTKLQSYGVLLVLDQKTLRIIQCSANVSELLETPINSIYEKPINAFIMPENLSDHISTWLRLTDKRYGRFKWNGEKNQIDIWVYNHLQGDVIILEIEHAQDIDLEDMAFSVFDEIINLKTPPSINIVANVANITCDHIRLITNYDRVLLYQFKSDNSGVVIGESIGNGMESFAGLHFPATDVPSPVREMYIHQPLRYIPQVDNHTIKLLQNHEVSEIPSVDLTSIVLRAVAPVHIEYLKNMGVSSSLSIAIIYNHKLWGLIACHSKNQKKLSLYYRFGLLLLAKVLGERLVLIETNEVNEAKNTISLISDSIHNTINEQTDIFSSFQQTKDRISDMLSADGIAIFYRDQLASHNVTPTSDQIIKLIDWLFSNQRNKLIFTEQLSVIYPESLEYVKIAAGLIAIPLTREEKNYLIIFRKELLSTVNWAGDPHSTITKRGDAYSPRGSFQSWKQTVTNQSYPWKDYEIYAAKELQATIISKELEIILQAHAQRDALTGLYNRRMLQENLSAEIARAKREKKSLGVMMLDIDFFKSINDVFGHAAGDLVLVKVSDLLRNIVRPYDCAYRYGGEEFILLLPDINVDDLMKRANEILENVRSLKIEFEAKVLPKITLSIGISLCPEQSDAPNELIEKADHALYQAKSTGRDKVIFYKD